MSKLSGVRQSKIIKQGAMGREAIIHLRVNYRYKRVQMVHILNKYVEYQYTVIPTLSP
jgi:hypothetical protein